MNELAVLMFELTSEEVKRLSPLRQVLIYDRLRQRYTISAARDIDDKRLADETLIKIAFDEPIELKRKKPERDKGR